MRSNAPLHARKSCPQGEPVLRWCGVTTRSARADVSRKAARRPVAAPGIGKIPQEGNETNSRDGTPHSTPSPRYNNTYLRNQPAHVLVVDLLQHFPAV